LKTEGERLRFTVRIESNDPALPVAHYWVHAEAPVVVRADPPIINFGDIPVGSSPVLNFRLFEPEGNPWPGRRTVEFKSAYNQVEVRRISSGGGRRELGPIEVRPRPNLPAGTLSDRVRVDVKDKTRYIEVVVNGYIRAPIVISPNPVYFGEVKAKMQPVRRRLLVRCSKDRASTRIVRTDLPPGIKLEEVKTSATSNGETKVFSIVYSPAKERPALDHDALFWFENQKTPVSVRLIALTKLSPSK
jgi:hypothetical protein